MELEPVGAFPRGNESSLAVSPDGRWTVSSRPGSACLWRGDELSREVALPGHVDGPIAFSSSGHQLWVGEYGVHLPDGEPTLTVDLDALMLAGIPFEDRAAPRAYTRRVTATSATGSRTALTFVHGASRGIGDDVGDVGPKGQAVLLDLSDDQFVAVLEADLGIFPQRSLAIDERHVVVAGVDLRLFDAPDGAFVAEVVDLDSMCISLALATSAPMLAMGLVSGDAEVRSVPDLALTASWSAHSDRVTAVAFHAGQPLAITGSDDEQVKIWSLDGDEPELIAWHWVGAAVRALAVHPYGEHVLVATPNEIVVLELSK